MARIQSRESPLQFCMRFFKYPLLTFWILFLVLAELRSTAQSDTGTALNFGLIKQQIHVQTGPHEVVPDPFEPFIFLAVVKADVFDQVQIRKPNGVVIALDLFSNNYDFENGTYNYSEPFKTKDTMDKAFPPGIYQAELHDLFGSADQTTNLELPAAEFYPQRPLITNYLENQGISPTERFKIRWREMDHGPELDSFAFAVVSNRSTKIWGFTGIADTLKETSIELPASTLTLGHSYAGVLIQQHWTAFGADGVTNGVFFGHVVQFAMNAPVEPLIQISLDTLNPAIGLRFNTVPDRQYQLIHSSDLRRPRKDWDADPPFTAESGYSSFTLPHDLGVSALYYGVRELTPR